MKNIIYALALFLLVGAFSSCVVLSPKKYKALLAKQDSLNTGWNKEQINLENCELLVEKLKKDTTNLGDKLREAQREYATLESNYAALRSNSSSEINKLSDNLKKLSDNLNKMSEDLKKREERLREVEEILRKRDEATLALKEKLQKALLGFQKSGLSVDIRNGKVYVSLTDKLLFSSGSIIIDENGLKALNGLATVLKTQKDINISVEGHTDNQRVNNLGQIKDNWDLSVLRATSVVRHLTDTEGIETERITATGKGEYQPLDKANTSEARSHNRRIEIVLSPKLDELYNLIK
ncbi:MAG: OmpA family protein [Sphingobacteriaceae bacterium]|nr:OmpA family protein [Sphingobacteriaceae bacterium]